MAKTEQEKALTKVIENWLDKDEEMQRFRAIAYPTKKDRIVHALRRRKRIKSFVDVFIMVLAGGEYHIPGKIIPERTTIETTWIKVDASSIMAIICGQIDKAVGYEPKTTKPEIKEKEYTHS